MNKRLKKWTALKLRKLAHRLDKRAPSMSWTGRRWLRITMSFVTMPPGSSPALKTSILVSAINTVSSSPQSSTGRAFVCDRRKSGAVYHPSTRIPDFARGPPDSADDALPRSVRHHLLWTRRSVPRNLRRSTGDLDQSCGFRRSRGRGPATRRCHLRLQR